LTLLKQKTYSKKLKVLIDKGLFSREEYDETINLYKKDPNDHKLRPHPIACKKGKSITSITIPNTQFRILITKNNCESKYNILSWIGKHREYDIIIKNQKNCKHLFLDCKELEKLDLA